MLRNTWSIGVVCILYSLVAVDAEALKPCGDAIEWVPDLDDCSVYYLCVDGISNKKFCAEGFSFRPSNLICVPKDSVYDTCVPSPCNGRTGKIPHPDSCAMYYDCSSTSRVDPTWEPRLRECVSPDLYNNNTKRCEDYRRVDCGTRYEPKSPCGYQANQCRRAHCVPCHLRFPSCENLSNGFHAWPGREGSPYYIGCRQERVIYQKECPKEAGAVQIFDDNLKKCVILSDNNV